MSEAEDGGMGKVRGLTSAATRRWTGPALREIGFAANRRG
jgi:hypothetical protein